MTVESRQDRCALPLMQRVAALLDRDPGALRDGDPIPRSWHVALFTIATPQRELRQDGLGGLGVTLPNLGLPRIMAGGKQVRFLGDIPIGAAVSRMSRIASVAPKHGRSGRFAIVGVEHEIFLEDTAAPVLTERQDYILREADAGGTAASPTTPPGPQAADSERTLVFDEAMLLRYCAITFNAHRIHYDLPYAMEREGYPALLVNGGLPALFLLEMFRAATGREPDSLSLRNQAPLFCNRPARLCLARQDDGIRLWAEDEAGWPAVEVLAT